MTHFETLLREMRDRGDACALEIDGTTVSYEGLSRRVDDVLATLAETVPEGAVAVSLNEFSLDGIATMLGLALLKTIVVPVSTAGEVQLDQVVTTSRAQFIVRADGGIERTGGDGEHDLYTALRRRSKPGLVLFSSGSTGAPKGAVHDFDKWLSNMPRRALDETLVAFLLYDHGGGVNTLLRSLSGGGTLVLPGQRSPQAVARAIEQHGATVLPTSPSFLALLLASGEADAHDLSSLRVITYGTEVMPQALLERVHRLLPEARLKQTYGLSEVGVMSTQSESDSSTWLRLGGDGFEVRVVDGMLEVKSESAMLGYLNAPSPFTSDGWFQTFDEVEVRDDLFRILGRRSEMINVGGLKVFPQEVESALLALPFINDCVVYGTPNPLAGQSVAADVVISRDFPDRNNAVEIRSAIRSHLRGTLEAYKIPSRLTIADADLSTARFKKTRTAR